MKIKEYRTQFIQELAPIYDVGEAENFFYLILEEKHKLKRIDLALQPDLVFSLNLFCVILKVLFFWKKKL